VLALCERQERMKCMYQFLLNMWIMRRVDESYLQGQVLKGRITQDEYNMIVATPQITVV